MSVVINGIQYVPRLALKAPAEFGTLGQALRAMRKQAKLSIDKAAAEIGRSKSYLWELEHDKAEPGLRVAAELAGLYGVPLATLAACLQHDALPFQCRFAEAYADAIRKGCPT